MIQYLVGLLIFIGLSVTLSRIFKCAFERFKEENQKKIIIRSLDTIGSYLGLKINYIKKYTGIGFCRLYFKAIPKKHFESFQVALSIMVKIPVCVTGNFQRMYVDYCVNESLHLTYDSHMLVLQGLRLMTGINMNGSIRRFSLERNIWFRDEFFSLIRPFICHLQKFMLKSQIFVLLDSHMTYNHKNVTVLYDESDLWAKVNNMIYHRSREIFSHAASFAQYNIYRKMPAVCIVFSKATFNKHVQYLMKIANKAGIFFYFVCQKGNLKNIRTFTRVPNFPMCHDYSIGDHYFDRLQFAWDKKSSYINYEEVSMKYD